MGGLISAGWGECVFCDNANEQIFTIHWSSDVLSIQNLYHTWQQLRARGLVDMVMNIGQQRRDTCFLIRTVFLHRFCTLRKFVKSINCYAMSISRVLVGSILWPNCTVIQVYINVLVYYATLWQKVAFHVFCLFILEYFNFS
jgi:hypothetical protein